jgi:hemoglobin-like flavoprotein
MESLDAVMSYLDQPERQAALLREMGRRHASYGATPAHYRIVAALLADALATLLDEHPNQHDGDTRADWLDAFNLISDHMLTGAPPPER